MGDDQSSADIRTLVQESIDEMQPLHVYGRVVDQFGQPVVGGKVHVMWTEVRVRPDPGQSKWVDVDNAGNWQITIKSPDRVSVRNIECEGYQFDRKTSAYFTAPNREELIRLTSKNDPLIISVRKKNDPTFLVQKEGRINLLPPTTIKKNNFIQRKRSRRSVILDQSAKRNWDLMVSATYLEEVQQWNITFSASGKEGGLLVTDSPAFEAPEDGYIYEYIESVPVEDIRRNLYLCIKSRDASLYSRVEIKLNVGKKMCIMSYEAWINPYGKRNLEFDEGLNEEWKLRKRLEREVASDVQKGQKPIEHDVKKLMKLEKEKRSQ